MTSSENSDSGVNYSAHDGEQVIADPVHIRALTHPVRLRLLSYLGDIPEATATECAEAIGESVASCSFHLRTLAKHGYIEPAERRGREKPWKVVSRSRSQVLDRNAPGAAHALTALASMALTAEAERILDWLRTAPAQPVEEVEASSVYSASYYLTLEETLQLREELMNVGKRFAGRVEHPELRPADARLVKLFGALNVDPHQTEPGDAR